MIKGIGIDCTHITRFAKIVENQKMIDKFINKIYSDAEKKHIATLQTPSLKSQYMASRWAIKEALIKSVGHPISPPQISTYSDQLNKPMVSWSNQQFMISLTHEEDLCIAVCIWLQSKEQP